MNVFTYWIWVNVPGKLTQRNFGKEFLRKGVGEGSSGFKSLDLRFTCDAQQVYHEMEGEMCFEGDHMYSCGCYN